MEDRRSRLASVGNAILDFPSPPSSMHSLCCTRQRLAAKHRIDRARWTGAALIRYRGLGDLRKLDGYAEVSRASARPFPTDFDAGGRRLYGST